jgi:hypothetical protein
VLAALPDETHVKVDKTSLSTTSASGSVGSGGDEQVIAMMPDYASLRNDNNFRHDCARFTEGLQNGHHEEEWLRQAWAAHAKRKRGDHDEYLADRFERDWEVELPPDQRPTKIRRLKRAAAAAEVKEGE